MSTTLQSVFAWSLASESEKDTATLISDNQFGHCVRLAPDAPFAIAGIPSGLKSFSIWIKRLSPTASLQCADEQGWSVTGAGQLLLRGELTGSTIPANQWFHVCTVYNGDAVSLYLNGEFIHQSTDVMAFSITALSYVSQGDVCLAHQHVMMHDLSPAGVAEDYRGALPTIQQSFIEVHPLNIAILSPAEGPYANYPDNKFFIVDAAGADAIEQRLTVSNHAESDILLKGSNHPAADRTHHHFECRIRNGIITQIADSLRFNAQAGWTISTPIQNAEDGSWSIFFLSNTDRTLVQNEPLSFTFSYRTADGKLGERGTHINVSYQQLELGSGKVLQGDRTKQIDVLNLSSNNVYITRINERITDTDNRVDQMEDASEHDIAALRDSTEAVEIPEQDKGDITSSSYQNLKNKVKNFSLSAATKLIDIVGNVNERLTLLDTEVDAKQQVNNIKFEALEAGPLFELSIHTPVGVVQQANDISHDDRFRCYLYLHNRSNKNISFTSQGKFTIRIPVGLSYLDLVANDNDAGSILSMTKETSTDSASIFTRRQNQTVFPAGGRWRFDFKDMLLNGLTGLAHIQLIIEGLEGYQTQHLEVPIEKYSRDLSRNVANGFTGLGTSAPKEKLDVQGNVAVSGTLKAFNMYLEGAHADITWRKGNWLNFGVVDNEQGKVIKRNYDPNQPDTYDSGYTNYMVITSTGSVGIGHNSPGSKLDVEGDVNARSKIKEKGHDLVPRGIITMWYGSVSDVPDGWLLCDGSSGTPDLRERFIVGAGRQYSPNNVGGAESVKLTANQSGLRSHTVSGSTKTDGKHRHEYLDTYMDENNPTSKGDYEDGDGVQYKWHRRTTYNTNHSNHKHQISINVAASNAIEFHENRPPYYALAYIMKD